MHMSEDKYASLLTRILLTLHVTVRANILLRRQKYLIIN